MFVSDLFDFATCCLEDVTWNTYPNASKLAKIVPLFNELVKVATNGYMVPLKVSKVFAKAHADLAIFDTKRKSLDELCDEASEQVRMVWKKFRELRQDQRLYDKVTEKAHGHIWLGPPSSATQVQKIHMHARHCAQICTRSATQWCTETDTGTATYTDTVLFFCF